jgi:hypothetical protein
MVLIIPDVFVLFVGVALFGRAAQFLKMGVPTAVPKRKAEKMV